MTTAAVAPAGPVAAGSRQASARRALSRVARRQVRRGALVVAALLAALPALVVVQYRETFSGALDVASLQALAANPAVRTLFGPPVALEDPGGFAVWRTGMVTTVLVAAWALLSTVRLTRGEEDAGRWPLLLAGSATRRTLLGSVLAVVLAAQLLVGAALAGGLLLAGTAAAGAVLHGTGTALTGALFAALGAVCAQVLPDRRSAAGAGAALLGTAIMARMVADGVEALGRLRWLSPFGVLAEVAPFAADDARPLLVLLTATVTLVGVALVAADRRDVGGGLVQVLDERAPRLRSMRSLPGFALRRSLRSTAGWAAGVGAYYLLIGLLTVSLTTFLQQNPRFAAAAGEAGFGGLGTAQGYVAATFSLLAVPVGLFAAGRIAADAADEASGRFVLLFSLPVARGSWLALHTFVVALACTGIAATAGVATWAGAAVVGSALEPSAALAGALSTVPVALVSLGAAVLALGFAPRLVLVAGALPSVGGFVLLVLADSFGWPEAVRQLSPFAHVAAVPVEGWDAHGAVGLTAVALVLATAGVLRYQRRDLLS